MSKKINYDNLYIAFPVYDYEVETEMYEQYVTFGTIEHRIIVNPKKKLIYSKIDENGKERFYDYKTNKQVFENSYESSFKTKSSPMQSLYCSYINGHRPMPIKGFRNQFLSEHNKKLHAVGYFIPFNEYIEKKLGSGISLLTPFIIDKLIYLMNIGSDKPFMLSMDPEEAKVQLEKIGYHKQNEKTVKKI